MQNTVTLKKTTKQYTSARSLIILIVAMIVVGLIVHLLTGGRFMTVRNMGVILANSIYPTFIAWALCFLSACGYTDMSMGGVLVLGSFGVGVFGNMLGYPGVVLGGLVCATLLIFINFAIFATTKIPSWIASISLALVYEAIAVHARESDLTRRMVDAELAKQFRSLGRYPASLIILVVGFVVVYFVYNRTTIGMNVRAVGDNATVARSLGISITRTLLMVGLICGLLMGVSCIIQESYNSKTFVQSGLTSIQLIFKPLAISMLAQILSKWINIIIVVPFCSIIIYAVFNIMTFFAIPSGTLQDVFLCIFVIVFGAIGQWRTKEVVK